MVSKYSSMKISRARFPLCLLIVPLLSSFTGFCGLSDEAHPGEWGGTMALANRNLGPQWSADGENIVFVRDVGRRSNGEFEDGSIYIAQTDGSSARRFTEGDGEYDVDYAPSISPDGRRVVYATSRHRTEWVFGREVTRSFEIEISNLDGSDRRRLTENGDIDTAPAWSPDGSRIAYLRIDDPNLTPRIDSINGGIYTMAADGSDLRWLVAFPTDEWDHAPYGTIWSYSGGPVWSPDGKLLAFPATLNEPSKPDTNSVTHTMLYSVGSDGSNTTRLFSAPFLSEDGAARIVLGRVAWSPDSQLIAFLNHDMASLKVYTVRPDGSDLTEVVDTQRKFAPHNSDEVPASLEWSLDGTRLLIGFDDHYRTIAPAAFTVNSDGTALTFIGRWSRVSWSPDGSSIAVMGPEDRGREITLSVVPLDGSDVRAVATISAEGDILFPSPDRTAAFLVVAAVGAGLSLTVGVGGFLIFRKWSCSRRADVGSHG